MVTHQSELRRERGPLPARAVNDYGVVEPAGAAGWLASGGVIVFSLLCVVCDGPAPGPRARYQTAINSTTMPMIPRIMPMFEPPAPSVTTTVSLSCSCVMVDLSSGLTGPLRRSEMTGWARPTPPLWHPSSSTGRLAQGRPTLQNRYGGISIDAAA